MTTRLYLPSSGTAPLTSLAIDSRWELSTGLVRRPCYHTKSNTALASTVTAWPATLTQQWCWYQFQSDTLAAAYDWTTSDTVSMVLGQCAESELQTDTHLAYCIRVVSGDGTSIRGTVGLFHTSSLEFPTFANGPRTRIFTARVEGATAFSSQIGDRIIVELGVHGVTPTQTTVQLRVGDTAALADFALTVGLATDLCPWVELSRTVSFGKALTRTEQVSASDQSDWEFQLVGPTIIIAFTNINY